MSNDKNNYGNGIEFSKFIDCGGRLYLPTTNQLMHNKYIIIDGEVLVTGSYNFTNGAEYNYENIIVTSADGIVSDYINNFNSLLEISACVKDFENEINKTEVNFSNILTPKRYSEIMFKSNPAVADELDLVADSLMEQYWSNNSATRGLAILSLIGDELFMANSQKLLIAAFITYLAVGDISKADRCLKKIVHDEKGKFISMIKTKVALNEKFALWLD